MATPYVPYEPGSIAVTAGDVAIVGTGTNFTAYDVYDFLLIADSTGAAEWHQIATITDDTNATLRFEYKSTTGSGRDYAWVPQSDMSRAVALFTGFAATLVNGVLESIADGDPSVVTPAVNDHVLGYDASSGDAIARFLLTATGAALLAAADAAGARTSLGVGTGDSPEFTGINLGHASDSTITRLAAGVAQIEGVRLIKGDMGTTDNRLLRADGTGQATAQNSAVTVDDSGNMSGVGTLAAGAITSTGLLTVPRIRAAASITITDDAVADLGDLAATAAEALFIWCRSTTSAIGHFFRVRSTSSPVCELLSYDPSSLATANTGSTPTGTTGADGKLNVYVVDDHVYIENRLGGTRIICYALFAGTAS